MNQERTGCYVGTVSAKNQAGLQLIDKLRQPLKGTDFRLSLMGRGPRAPFRDENPNVGSYLPLHQAEKIDIYVRLKSDSSGGYQESQFWAKKLRGMVPAKKV